MDFSVMVTVMVKTVWERDDEAFILVAAVVLRSEPSSRILSTSCLLSTTTSSRPCKAKKVAEM